MRLVGCTDWPSRRSSSLSAAIVARSFTFRELAGVWVVFFSALMKLRLVLLTTTRCFFVVKVTMNVLTRPPLLSIAAMVHHILLGKD